MTHTPGPWYIGDPRNEEPAEKGALFSLDGERVAACWDEMPIIATHEDLRLMAAAPELLEALEAVLEQFNCDYYECTSIKKAHAAIAKARGDA